jgi:LytS/YehU family sensor histidine kinase
VDGEAVYLPSLMLQTLVENAVKHGIGPSVEGGRVAVSVVRSGSDALWYVMKVSNSGSPLRKPDSTPSSKSSGTGIVNTTQRLDLLYGARHGFRLETDPSGMTVASFEFSGERHE